MQLSGRYGSAQSVGFQIQLLGHFRDCLFIIQHGLDLLEQFRGQYSRATASGWFKKTGNALFPVSLYTALDANSADPKGPAYIRLFGTAVNIKLTCDHPKCFHIINGMGENRQAAVNIRDRSVPGHHSQVEH